MRKVPESEVLTAVRLIEKLTNEGWSIAYARKQACGGSMSSLFNAVSKHPSYLPILNNYMNKLGHNVHFYREGLKLVPRKRNDRT